MRISNVELIAPPGMILVVLDTDEGAYGIGEVGMRHRPWAVYGAMRHLADALIGEDPRRIEHLWQTMRRGGFFPLAGDVAAAAAAIDVALWDIRGKLLGVPVHQLLGGRTRDYVTCYAHAPAQGDTQDPLAACRDLLARGYTHIRFAADLETEPVYEPRLAMLRAIEVLRTARAGLGDDVELLLDVHTRLDPPQAATLCRELEAVRPYFVEDPLRVENPHAYTTLRSRTAVPLAAGEQWTSLFEFRPVIEQELIDYARVDVANTGLTDAHKIAAMAEAHHINLATHNPLGPVTTASSMHLNLAVSNFGVQELAAEPHAHGGVFTRLPRCVGGRLHPDDTAPGLGVDIDREAARDASARGPLGGPLTVCAAGRPTDPPRLRHPDGSFTNW